VLVRSYLRERVRKNGNGENYIIRNLAVCILDPVLFLSDRSIKNDEEKLKGGDS
jgi:hypothetical protein